MSDEEAQFAILDQLFKQADKDYGEASHLAMNTAVDLSAKHQTQTHGEKMRLFQTLTMKKWEQLSESNIAAVKVEASVGIMDVASEGFLQTPVSMRKPVTGRFFLQLFQSWGCFNELHGVDIYTVESTNDTYIVCTLISHQINTIEMLLVNIVFRLEDANASAWSEKNINDTMRYTASVCKVHNEGLKILQEKMTLINFYFVVIPHNPTEQLVKMSL